MKKTSEDSSRIEPPSVIIWQKLEELGWSQNDFANVAGISLKHVSEILNNKKHITLETAKIFEKVFDEPVFFWLQKDVEYRLYLEELGRKGITANDDISQRAYIYKYNPVSEMVRRGWIGKTKKLSDLKKEILKFWNIEELNFDFLEEPHTAKGTLYKTGNIEVNPYYTQVWLKVVKEKCKSIPVPTYEKAKLISLLELVPDYTKKPEGIKEFLEELKAVGVKFVVFPHLKKTAINGAAFLDQNTPVVVFTLRYDRLDHFWFVLLHEISHILLHKDLLKSGHVDFELTDEIDQKEKEANDKARELLRYKEILSYFQGPKREIYDSEIERIARTLNLHVSIVRGALASSELIFYSRIHSGNSPVSRSIPEEYFLEKKERGRK